MISQKDLDEGMTLRVEYLGGPTVRLKGAVTGRSYSFSGLDRVQDVDPRDAMTIVRDRHFRLKGVTRRQ